MTNKGTIKTVGTGSQMSMVCGNCGMTNSGTLAPGKGGLININGQFSNFSGTTLKGGTYQVAGTLQFNSANIVTNAAKITLTGTTSKIIDQNGTDALANFASNAAKALFALASGKTLVVPTLFSNAGTLKVGAGTSFQATTYTQSAGTTTVDGTLTAPSGTTIQAGSVFGKGTIASTVTSSGSVTAGDSLTKAGKLSPSTYTQNANGSLNVQIGGLTVGTQYSRLAVLNGASLNGTLNITLINGYVPQHIGDTFTILTGNAITGQFSTVNGLSINSSEHFQISYGPTSVTLTVEPGA